MTKPKTLIPILALLLPFQATITKAQIIPDNTLGAESSVVTEIQNKIEQISGGATRRNNLFHSFIEFSINQGRKGALGVWEKKKTKGFTFFHVT